MGRGADGLLNGLRRRLAGATARFHAAGVLLAAEF